MVYEKNKSSKSNRKGQAAMEYLMTYGWAILVIVIVLAVLLFLNPFKAPETCLFQQPGFSCSEAPPQIYASADGAHTQISFKLFNKLGQTVKGVSVVCTTASLGDIEYSKFNPGKTLAAKDSKTSLGAGGSQLFTGECYNADGEPISSNKNSQFKGVVAVWYNYENDPNPDVKRYAAATIVTNVLEQTK